VINVVLAARGARGYRTDADPAAIGSPSSRRRRTTATVTPTVEHVRMISLVPRRTHAGRPYLSAITPVVANRAGGGVGRRRRDGDTAREQGAGVLNAFRSRHARAVVVGGGGGASRTDVGARRAVDTTASKSSTTRTRRRQLRGRRDPALGMETAARESRFQMIVSNRSRIPSTAFSVEATSPAASDSDRCVEETRM